MKTWIRTPVIVAIIVLALVALPLQALPEASAEPAETGAWSLQVPQVLVTWMQALLGLTGTDGTAPVDDGTTTTECGPACDDGSGGDGDDGGPAFGPTFDPNG